MTAPTAYEERRANLSEEGPDIGRPLPEGLTPFEKELILSLRKIARAVSIVAGVIENTTPQITVNTNGGVYGL